MTRSLHRQVDVQIDVADVVEQLSDDEIEGEARRRGVSTGAPSFDLIEEIRSELLAGRTNAALALIESHLVAARIPDDQRQRQYNSAGRVH